jgi:hypothetical protein
MQTTSHPYIAIKYFSALLVALSLTTVVAPLAAQKEVQPIAVQAPFGTQHVPSSKPAFIRVTVINMSGKQREAIIRKSKIDLPIAQRVALQLQPGEQLRVTSTNDSKLAATYLISDRDAGRLIPIH